MRTTRQYTSDLEYALGYHQREEAAIAGDRHLSELRADLAVSRRNARLEGLHSYTAERVAKIARALWGSEEDPSLALQGGQFWVETEEAARLLREAKTAAAAEINYDRLGVEISRLGETLRSVRNADEAMQVYADGDDYLRLALETQPDAVRLQLPGDPGVGSAMATLRANRERRFHTEKVVEAEQRVADAQQAGITAYKLTRRAADVLGLSGPFQSRGVGAIVGSIKADYSIEPSTLAEHWQFSKRGPRVMTRTLEPQGV